MNPKKAKRAAYRAIQALFRSLPRIHCQGRCQASCHLTADLFSELELDMLTERLGHTPAFPSDATIKVGDDLSTNCIACPLLNEVGRCSEYGHRPLMCRLWGIVADPLMVCPFGCKPERYLSNGEVRRIYAKLTEINDRYLCETQIENHAEDEP